MPIKRRDSKDALMQLYDPWASGDGAEASIWTVLREGRLPRDTNRLSVRARPTGIACPCRLAYPPGDKGPKTGAFLRPHRGGIECLMPGFRKL